MTRLLVSVRSVDEARAALSGGADVIDVKEPKRGPLGQADDSVILQVLELVAGRKPVSAALGELVTISDSGVPGAEALRRPSEHAKSSPLHWGVEDSAPATRRRIAWAKIGLSHCDRSWQRKWLTWAQLLPTDCGAVLVAYADAGPPLAEIVTFVAQARPAAFLIDTAIKDRQTLLRHFDLAQIADLIVGMHDIGVPIALAGSLDASGIAQLLPLKPDYLAVRGAACVGGRLGTVSAARVRDLARLVVDARSG